MRVHAWCQQAALVTLVGLGLASPRADAHAADYQHQLGLGIAFSFPVARRGERGTAGRIHIYYEASRFGRNRDHALVFGVEMGHRGVRDDDDRLEFLGRIGGGRIEDGYLGHKSLVRTDMHVGVSYQLANQADLSLGLSGRLGPLATRVSKVALTRADGTVLIDIGLEFGLLSDLDLTIPTLY